MPKEITYGDSSEYVLTHEGHEVKPGEINPGPVLRRAAVVGWQRDPLGYVEVGIQSLEVATEASSSQPGQSHPGQFASFDRAGLNRLIRSLRKARDQAFGADA